jgi:antirestriction protein ArdC
VTGRLIEALERGTVPWRKEWDAPRFRAPLNLTSGKPYHGINFFLLSLAGEAFGSPYWLTFRQALERGGHVRKGAQGVPVFFWKVLDRKAESADSGPDSEHASRRFVARYYTVFNVEQCDGIEYPKPERTTREIPAVEACDRILATNPAGPEIHHGASGASYAPIGDVVGMPDRSAFHSPEGYYATLFHELIHSTGHPRRLARFTPDSPPPPFGSPDYSREELVAELGAACLCAQAGISNSTIDNSAAYLAGWLQVLKADRRTVVFAAGAATKAASLIAGAEAR